MLVFKICTIWITKTENNFYKQTLDSLLDTYLLNSMNL